MAVTEAQDDIFPTVDLSDFDARKEQVLATLEPFITTSSNTSFGV